MLSQHYTLKSNELKQQYIHEIITLETYLSSLEALKRAVGEEIATFELRQLAEATQERTTRRKEAEALRLQLETEKTKQLELRRQQQLGEEKKGQPLSLQEKLLKARTYFYEHETPRLIETYKKDAKRHRGKHDRRQIIVLVCSALVTAISGTTIFLGVTTVSISAKLIATLLSLAVTIASGSLAYFK